MTHANKIDGGTAALGNGALTATGAETVYDSAAFNYAIIGKMYTKAAQVDGVTPLIDGNGATLTPLTANQGCVLVWTVDTGGIVTLFQSEIEALDVGGNFEELPQFPAYDDDSYCAFAYQVLKAGATAGTIVIGTSNWNAAGFTNAIQNVFTLPQRPQAA